MQDNSNSSKKLIAPLFNYHPFQQTNSSDLVGAGSSTDYGLSAIIVRVRGKPFWCHNTGNRLACCFNHIIGLPEKDGKALDILDYENEMYDALQQFKYLWIKKATGLGVTEFFLRYLAWICLSKDALKQCKICIVTGPRLEIAITLIDRIKQLLEGAIFETKNTVVILNECKIEAFPSHHLDNMRGLTDVKFILLDEADFFPPSEQDSARDVSERYIGKSDPHIVMISTPNVPGGLFDKMENDKDPQFLYHRMFLPYTRGLGKIYNEEEIAKARRSPSFQREYNLRYGYGTGNVFLPEQIDRLVDRDGSYLQLSSQTVANADTAIGVDPGFGSSNFAICVTALLDQKLNVLYCRQFEKSYYMDMENLVFSLMKQYNAQKVYIDAANPAFIRALKTSTYENPEYEKVIAECKKDKILPGERMRIIPMSFRESGKEMLTQLAAIVSDGSVQIHESHKDLILQLRTVKIKPSNGQIEKNGPETYDLFDAFMLSCNFWRFG
jgi:hypothetical protein